MKNVLASNYLAWGERVEPRAPDFRKRGSFGGTPALVRMRA